jgi:hypothetical protein
MNTTCTLQPFPGNRPSTDLRLTATASRQENIYAIQYSLVGRLSELAIPAPAPISLRQNTTPRPGAINPAEAAQRLRKNNLWEDTCFEFFLAAKHSAHYWEFNLSPSGHWNVYRFAAYRQGMKEESAFTELAFAVHRQADSLSLNLRTDLGRIVEANQVVEIALCAVIKSQNGDLTFWALDHRGAQADFHLRDSFIVEL